MRVLSYPRNPQFETAPGPPPYTDSRFICEVSSEESVFQLEDPFEVRVSTMNRQIDMPPDVIVPGVFLMIAQQDVPVAGRVP